MPDTETRTNEPGTHVTYTWWWAITPPRSITIWALVPDRPRRRWWRFGR